jgi:D-threo-aldose 1-dehydrogenase
LKAEFYAFLIERDSMEKRRVGRTELKIDVIGLGGAPLDGNFADLNYAQGVETVSSALEAGMSYFDTAPCYGFGRSQRAIWDQLHGKN